MKRSFEYPDMGSIKYLFTFKYKKGGQQGLGMGEMGRCWSRVQISNLYSSKELNRRRQWHPTPVLLPGNSHGWRSLVGCSLWGRKESDTTEQLHFDFSLSRIGEGTGNPLQCSCLENPRDGGAWWAAVYGVAQSRTRLKRLSSSSSTELNKSAEYNVQYGAYS